METIITNDEFVQNMIRNRIFPQHKIPKSDEKNTNAMQ